MTMDVHAVRRLPVIQPIPDPLARPQTVGDCRNGPRPCPRVWCRNNLLVDVLDDGSLVLNAPSKRLKGADRTIAAKHEFDGASTWYVEVALPPKRVGDALMPQIFALGPLGSAERAKEIAAAWESEVAVTGSVDNAPRPEASDRRVLKAEERASKITGAASDRARAVVTKARKSKSDRKIARARERADRIRAKARARAAEIVMEAKVCAADRPAFTRIYRKIPDDMEVVGAVEGSLDAKFSDEAEDAVEYWFDDPDRVVPSCLLDEIDRLDSLRVEAARSKDDGHLLEQIAEVMFVSRERVRQVEHVAKVKFNRALAGHGLSITDLWEQD